MRGGAAIQGNLFVVIGTRPEAVKLAPVIAALRGVLPVTVCATGQHRDLLDTALADFGIVPDLNLDLMRSGQRPEDVVAAALPMLRRAITATRAAAVIVQGDTASAFAGAQAGAYAGVPVVHVEAGLRSDSIAEPFPEELHRRAIAQLSTLHFAPTAAAAAALLEAGIPAAAVHLVGNTGIDALLHVAERLTSDTAARAHAEAMLPVLDAQRPLLLATVHRRENHGARLNDIATALEQLAVQHGAQVVVPVHPNPAVRSVLEARLGHIPAIHLVPPLRYPAFVTLLQRARAVLTDSGGVQEEAPALGCPVLVLRSTTERREGVAAGTALLVGTDPGAIIAATRRLLTDDVAHARMARVALPYGDGRAATRIAAILAQTFSAAPRTEALQQV